MVATASVDRLGRAGTGGRPRALRAEIQGLRAIAVAAVVVYHLHPAALPGGYVGVDVFFVVSGFLITRHLVQEASRTGRVDLDRFWAGRARRILPAQLVTTVAVVAVASMLLSRTAAADAGRTAWWAALSAANWLFAADAVDYQAQSPDASPFEHFWSLGVEEQFYVVWPVLMLAAAVIARRRGVLVGRLAVVPVGAVLVASLVFGVVFTATGSAAAYFVTPTRTWELAAGGLLAVLLGDRQPAPRLAGVLQACGVGLIVLGCVALDSGTPMPGTAALLPVLGAVAVIAGGEAPGLRRLWSTRPVRGLGDVSYSLYLWHWPVIVFARHLAGGALGIRATAAAVVLSLVLALASYRLIEQPGRRIPVRRPGRVVAAGGVAIALVVAIGAVPVVRADAASAATATARQAVLDPAAGPAIGYPGLDAAADGTWARTQHVVVPDATALADDLTLRECSAPAGAAVSAVCVRGDRASRTTVAMVGDSHLRQWGSAIDAIGRAHRWRILTVLHNSCPFSLVPRAMEVEGRSRCTQAVRRVLPLLRQQGVQVVLTSAYRKSYAEDDVQRAADGYAAMWGSLEAAGLRVVVLGDTPTPSAAPLTVDCITERDPASCGVPRAVATAWADPLSVAAAAAPEVAFVDPVDAFCGTRWCPGVIGNVGVWVDDNHASRTYIRTTEPWVEQHVAPLIERALAR